MVDIPYGNYYRVKPCLSQVCLHGLWARMLICKSALIGHILTVKDVKLSSLCVSNLLIAIHQIKCCLLFTLEGWMTGIGLWVS